MLAVTNITIACHRRHHHFQPSFDLPCLIAIRLQVVGCGMLRRARPSASRRRLLCIGLEYAQRPGASAAAAGRRVAPTTSTVSVRSA